MTQAPLNKAENESSKKALSKISPATADADVSNNFNPAEEKNINLEKTTLEATRLLLREFSIRKSAAAIRDAVEFQNTKFGPKEAVSALSNLGFKASFGGIKVSQLVEDYFPLIAFQKDGEALLIREPPVDDKLLLINPITNDKIAVTLSEFKKNYSNFFILVKPLNDRERRDRSGHWFFSSFQKSKWIYVQVMIAAMVSNFLSLTTALFTDGLR